MEDPTGPGAGMIFGPAVAIDTILEMLFGSVKEPCEESMVGPVVELILSPTLEL